MSTFFISSNGLEVASRIAGFWPIAMAEMHVAMQDSLLLLETDAQAYMWDTFYDPTGPLEDAFEQDIKETATTMTGQLINPMVYAWRREMGFSGMTDSLGRYYVSDPGIEYMHVTLGSDEQVVVSYFKQALSDAIKIVSVP